MIFVDTGAMYALAVVADANHERALMWHATATEQLVTTEHVIGELLTLLRARGHHAAALAFGERLFGDKLVTIEWATRTDIERAWAVFHDYDDKAWSFIDCLSRVVMERLNIDTAFAFDRHFRQFGTVRVVPG